jgi:CRP-like cAMP-binding protein
LHELLTELPVFEGLSDHELVQIGKLLHRRTYAQDELVFNENEPGAGMYIISRGTVVITKETKTGEQLYLATIEARSFFGEIALLDEIPRSASAHAGTRTELFAFCKPDLEKLIERNPRLGVKILYNISRMICRRLLVANDNVEELQEKVSRLESAAHPTHQER